MRSRFSALFILAALTTVVAVAACQATAPTKDRPEIPDGPPPPDMMQATQATQMTTIAGNATYFEKIGLPAGCTLRVQLVNTRLADTATAIVTDQVFPVVHGSPIPFALTVDNAKLDERMSYALSASVRAPDGSLLFTTDTSVPVDLKSSAPVSFRMKMTRK